MCPKGWFFEILIFHRTSCGWSCCAMKISQIVEGGKVTQRRIDRKFWTQHSSVKHKKTCNSRTLGWSVKPACFPTCRSFPEWQPDWQPWIWKELPHKLDCSGKKFYNKFWKKKILKTASAYVLGRNFIHNKSEKEKKILKRHLHPKASSFLITFQKFENDLRAFRFSSKVTKKCAFCVWWLWPKSRIYTIFSFSACRIPERNLKSSWNRKVSFSWFLCRFLFSFAQVASFLTSSQSPSLRFRFRKILYFSALPFCLFTETLPSYALACCVQMRLINDVRCGALKSAFPWIERTDLLALSDIQIKTSDRNTRIL